VVMRHDFKTAVVGWIRVTIIIIILVDVFIDVAVTTPVGRVIDSVLFFVFLHCRC